LLVYSIKRLISALPTLFIMIAVAFFMIRIAPGGPFDTEKNLPPEIEANLMAAYHLDEPTHKQFWRYLKNLSKGDFGPSFQYKDYTVTELIKTGFPVSIKLGLSAMVLALIFGILAGTVAAVRQNTHTDHATMFLAMTGISIPNFVMAPILILIFAVFLKWLPAGGWGPAGSLKHMVLPVIALALPQIAYISRLTRGSMVEVLRSNFIRTARAKGLSEQAVIFKHALKPALLPVVSYLGPATAAILTGSVVIEQIFGVPGLGRYFVQGALNRDYTLVVGVIVFYGALIIVFNFLVDLIYGLLDPKVRYS
jgi:oligopeptide transport system permease protein